MPAYTEKPIWKPVNCKNIFSPFSPPRISISMKETLQIFFRVTKRGGKERKNTISSQVRHSALFSPSLPPLAASALCIKIAWKKRVFSLPPSLPPPTVRWWELPCPEGKRGGKEVVGVTREEEESEGMGQRTVIAAPNRQGGARETTITIRRIRGQKRKSGRVKPLGRGNRQTDGRPFINTRSELQTLVKGR